MINLLEIIDRHCAPSAERLSALAAKGYHIEPMPASWLSAATAMRLAKMAQKTQTQAVLVHNLDDAMAAVSARKLVPHALKIIMAPAPNSRIPRGIADDIALGVDLWIFPSQRMLEVYPRRFSNTRVETPRDYDLKCPADARRQPQEGRLLWIGPIDSNVESLLAVIDQIDKARGTLTLVVLGTGKARHVMRAVRKARAISRPEKVVWLGQEGDVLDEALKCQFLLQSSPDITPTEATLSQDLDIPILNPISRFESHL